MLNVDRATRSSMIREDRLPDMKQVITSDMGLRMLHRNQVLTAMDEAKVELEYLLKQRQQHQDDTNSNAVVDAAELRLWILEGGERTIDATEEPPPPHY